MLEVAERTVKESVTYCKVAVLNPLEVKITIQLNAYMKDYNVYITFYWDLINYPFRVSILINGSSRVSITPPCQLRVV